MLIIRLAESENKYISRITRFVLAVLLLGCIIGVNIMNDGYRQY